ncbi:MAG: hypothetical protein WBB39_00915 [Candidatus Saccharimonadales bacterium]
MKQSEKLHSEADYKQKEAEATMYKISGLQAQADKLAQDIAFWQEDYRKKSEEAARLSEQALEFEQREREEEERERMRLAAEAALIASRTAELEAKIQ